MMDRRGSVALWIVCAMPLFIVSVALPIEVGAWEHTKIALQRIADVSALAGMLEYKARWGQSQSAKELRSRQMATGMARLNKPAGATMTETAETVEGLADDGPAVFVTVSQTIPLLFLGSLNGRSSFTITATAVAELIGPEPGPHDDTDNRQPGLVR